ncbi:hypothetical protein WME79_17440 [Sorangium sp. So ce726]
MAAGLRHATLAGRTLAYEIRANELLNPNFMGICIVDPDRLPGAMA